VELAQIQGLSAFRRSASSEELLAFKIAHNTAETKYGELPDGTRIKTEAAPPKGRRATDPTYLRSLSERFAQITRVKEEVATARGKFTT